MKSVLLMKVFLGLVEIMFGLVYDFLCILTVKKKEEMIDLLSLREVICDVLHRAVAWGGAGGPCPLGFSPVFCPKKSKHARIKVENRKSSPRAVEQ